MEQNKIETEKQEEKEIKSIIAKYKNRKKWIRPPESWIHAIVCSAEGGDLERLKWIKSQIPELFKAFVRVAITEEQDPETEEEKRNTTTALHKASQKGHQEIVKLLVENGANVNQKDNIQSKKVPLQLAIRSKNEKTIQYLIESGADLEYIYFENETLAMLAEKRGFSHLLPK